MTYRDDMLTEELAELLERDVPSEQAPEELRSLISLATTVREHSEVARPDPTFRHELRRHLIREIEASQVTWLDRVRGAIAARTASWRNSARIAVASSLASSLIGGAGVAVAAQQALPGDVLYDVKRVTESARMAIASGADETGRLHLELAAERLEEVTGGLDRLSADEMIDTLEDMDEASLAGAEDLTAAALEAADPGPLRDTLENFVDAQRDGLSAIFTRLPAEVVPAAEESLEVLARIDAHVAATATTGAGPAPPPVSTTPPPDADADGPAGADVRDTGDSSAEVGEADSTDGDGDGDDGGVVPTLPDPLDDVGDAVDDALEESLSGEDAAADDEVTGVEPEAGDAPSPAPSTAPSGLSTDPDPTDEPTTDASVDDLLG